MQYTIFNKMANKASIAAKSVYNPKYAQQAMKRAMTAMLELSMASMYKDAMSKAVEADFRQGVRDYHARSLNMAESWNDIKKKSDHYKRKAKV